MSLDDDATRSLETWLAGALAARAVRITERRRLSGGAIQENWAVDLEIDGGPRQGTHQLVLRTDSPSAVAVSLSRAEEFELMSAAWNAGVTVPEPLLVCTDEDVIGKQFVLMGRVAGIALGPRVVKDRAAAGDGERLVERLGNELARIHAITPNTHRFDFLPPPADNPALDELQRMRRHLDDLDQPRPVLEWTLRWLERRAPPRGEIVLAHHDFRTGNYMVDKTGLTAILDWEFAGWSDPHEDIGWFCAMCWRFSGRTLEAGGIGSRETFYRGYTTTSDRSIDPVRVYWWEVYAHLRWAVIALQQGDRFLVGGEASLNLALTGLMAVELENELLRMTAPGIERPGVAA